LKSQYSMCKAGGLPEWPMEGSTLQLSLAIALKWVQSGSATQIFVCYRDWAAVQDVIGNEKASTADLKRAHKNSRVMVVHAYNPGYLGGWDQEVWG
jgi:hypothetical protein